MRTGMSDEYLGWHFHTGKEQHGSRHKIVDNVGEIVRQLLDLQRLAWSRSGQVEPGRVRLRVMARLAEPRFVQSCPVEFKRMRKRLTGRLGVRLQ